MPKKKTRVTVDFNIGDMQQLNILASEAGATKSGIIKSLVRLGKIILSAIRDGDQIVIHKKDGSQMVMVFTEWS